MIYKIQSLNEVYKLIKKRTKIKYSKSILIFITYNVDSLTSSRILTVRKNSF